MAKRRARSPSKRERRPLYAVDFFCGAGGMTVGLRQAGVRVIAGVDNDNSVARTYIANHGPESRFILRDVRSCTGRGVRSWLPRGVSADDLILVGCSPCQFWSHVPSNKARALAGSTLLLELGRLVHETRPGYVVIENVPGLMKAGRKKVLRPFMRRLEADGYYALVCEEVRSAWFGVPQMRPRVLLLASRLHAEMTLPMHDRTLAPRVRDFIGRKRAFRSLSAGETAPEDPWHRASELSEDNLRRLRMTPHDGGDRSAWRDTSLQIEAYQGRDEIFRNVYGRMWWDRPAPTLTTRFNSLSNGRFGHPEEDRAVSVREGATLQTFPRDYVFEGSLQGVCRQIGNAVPPFVGAAIGRHLLEMHRALPRGAAQGAK